MKTKIVEFGDLKPGDKLLASDGSVTEVVKAYDKHLPERMFEIEMDDGEVVQASGNHLWYCETDSDEQFKEEYRKLAEDYFANNDIPDWLIEDHHFPIELIVKMFGDDIPTILFIEKACKSLGHSSVTPHVMLVNQLRDQVKEEIKNYSYNDLIEFLYKMKKAIQDDQGYFYFGEVRETVDIARLMSYNQYVNIPHRGEIL